MLFVDVVLIQNICRLPEWKDLNKAYCTLIILQQHKKHMDPLLIFKKVLVLQFFHPFTDDHTDKGEDTQSYVDLSPCKGKLGLQRLMDLSQEAVLDLEKNVYNKTLTNIRTLKVVKTQTQVFF